MSISQFYKDNSHSETFNAVSNPFTFKRTYDLTTLFEDGFDDSIAFSSNILPFYHNYQYGSQFQYFSDYSSGLIMEQNPEFEPMNNITTKICLLYSPTNTYSSNSNTEYSWYLYNSKENKMNWSSIYNFNHFSLVTDFPFDRLVCTVEIADTKFSTGEYHHFDDITDDNHFNSITVKLYYRNDDYTLTDISGYFVLAELIKTDDNIILSTLSNRNPLGSQTYTSYYITQAKEYTEYAAHNDENYFLHSPTSTELEFSDAIERYKPDDENTGLWCVHSWNGNYNVRYNVTVNKQLALNIISAMGLRFISCNPSLITDKTTYDDHIKLAVMDESGYVDYNNILVGSEAIDNSNTYNKTIDLETSPDIPDKPNPYPKEDDKITPVDYRYINEIGGFTRYYRVSRAQLSQIISNINTATDLPEGYEFLPHIVSVRQYPFNTAQYVHGTTKNIVIGGYDTGVEGYDLDSTQMSIQTIATITIPNKYNSFLDKAPYTQLSLYIPCCGWIDLPDICTGRTITVELAHDIINGGCIGIVKLDGMPIVQTAGKMGTDISISATENGLKQAALTQSAFAVGGGVLSTGFALATGNPVGVFSGIMSTASALSQGNIANNSNYTHQIGNTGDKSNDHISTKCYLRISFPITDIPKNFAHTYGYICNQTHKISECKGFTVCDKVDLSGVMATENEKVRLRQILESGFYC